jgi:valyl-tRNA synthetase
LGSLIAREAERARLDRDLEKIEQALSRLEAKLVYAGFTEKAPAHVVEQERSKQADLLSRRERIQDSLADLSRKSR